LRVLTAWSKLRRSGRPRPAAEIKRLNANRTIGAILQTGAKVNSPTSHSQTRRQSPRLLDHSTDPCTVLRTPRAPAALTKWHIIAPYNRSICTRVVLPDTARSNLPCIV